MTVQKFLQLEKDRLLNISVIGDCVIDEHYLVTANRVSPEFPIPVMLSPQGTPDVVLPGGAANTCCQFKHFNVSTKLYALTDKLLQNALSTHRVNTANSIKMPSCGHVPLKRRYYQGDFPLCRLDVEEKNYGLDGQSIDAVRQALYERYLSALTPDVAIFSDYNKGLFSTAQNWIKAKNCITIVDPKKGPLSQWVGCSVFKPNSNEALELSGGIKNWKDQCGYFYEKLAHPAVVITQGSSGVVGIVNGKLFEFRPDKSVSAESVIGAGDCFVAFMAMALGLGMDMMEAVEVAWEAGTLYVQRKHNQPVDRYELLSQVDSIAAKLVDPEWLALRDFDLTFTNGCFDLLHPGHLSILRYCKSIGNQVVVAVNSDESVKKLKGQARPIIPLRQRMEMLASLDCVDYVLSFDETHLLELIKIIQPDVMVKGADWKNKKVTGSELVEDVRFFDFVHDISTSKIILQIG